MKTHEPPYDGYETVTNPDRTDLDRVLADRDARFLAALGGDEIAERFWSVWLEYLRQREELG